MATKRRMWRLKWAEEVSRDLGISKNDARRITDSVIRSAEIASVFDFGLGGEVMVPEITGREDFNANMRKLAQEAASFSWRNHDGSNR